MTCIYNHAPCNSFRLNCQLKILLWQHRILHVPVSCHCLQATLVIDVPRCSDYMLVVCDGRITRMQSMHVDMHEAGLRNIILYKLIHLKI